MSFTYTIHARGRWGARTETDTMPSQLLVKDTQRRSRKNLINGNKRSDGQPLKELYMHVQVEERPRASPTTSNTSTSTGVQYSVPVRLAFPRPSTSSYSFPAAMAQ